MTKLLTFNYKSHLINQLLESVTESANTAYYAFVADHDSSSNSLIAPSNDTREILIDVYRNMIFGKRVANTDVSLVVRNVPYETNKAFAMYDDNDKNLETKDFYCMVDEGALFHVYKCLDNNLGSNSTVAPSLTYASNTSNYIFRTSDGYVWKYMYSVTNSVKSKFATETYFPVIRNTDVETNSKKGVIDVIKIETTGKGYDNYLTGTFSSTDLRVSGNPLVYKISNSNISYTQNFYNGCSIYLSEGNGAGQYRTISSYISNANGNFITLSSEFDSAFLPTNGTKYEIYPSINVVGSGSQTSNAIARALVNSIASNSIYRIEMLTRGENYDFAVANVVISAEASNTSRFEAASVRPIYSPTGGHGSDNPSELYASAIEFSVAFSNTESNTILTTNKYQQVGIMKDPQFANVNIEVKNVNGTFTIGETIVKIDPLRINANVLISNTSSILTSESSVLSNATIVSSGTSGSYAPNTYLTIVGGTPVINAQLKVLTSEVRSVEITANGSNYNIGDQLTFSYGYTTNTVLQVTSVSSNGITGITIINAGSFSNTTLPTNPLSANSTTGAGSGAQFNFYWGVRTFEISNQGAYASIPTAFSNAATLANSGTGTGARFSLSFTTSGLSDFLNQLSSNDYVYITSSDGNQHQIAQVNNITNATHLTLKSTGLFSCSQALMYIPNMSSTSKLTSVVNAANIRVTNLEGQLSSNDTLIGLSSSTKAQVNTITRNDVSKGFDTFVQLYKYDMGLLSEQFIENEIVYQGSSNATVHSVVSNSSVTILYTSNQVGQFSNTSEIRGLSSGTRATINKAYSPELVFASGEVLYLENIDAVERESDKTERFKIIFTF